MHRKLHYAVRLALLASMMAGCTIGPDYVKPDMAVPAAFKEQQGWKTAQPQDELPRGNWWELFGDSELNALVSQVEVSNQNIRAVEAQYRQARALAQQAHAAYYPTLSASLSANRRQIISGSGSNNDLNNININTTNLNSATINSTSNSGRSSSSAYSAGLNASWEPDIWGRVQRSVEAGTANVQASGADVAAARLSAQAELVQDYFLLRIADARAQLLNDTVAAYERSFKLTQNQYAVGVVARADVVNSETQLKTARAQAVDARVQRAQLEHAIAVLIGKAPAELTIPFAPVFNTLPPAIPAGIPSQLLERRPDIAAAERRAAAANAQIGVAQAAYYPAITLSTALGLQSSSFASLFSAPTTFWTLGAALAQTLFDGGLRKAQTAQAIAVYDQNAASYRQAILTAFQEVEDNLSSLSLLEQEAQLQEDAVKSSREAVQIATNQYKAGLVNFLDVVNVEAIALNNERTALTVQSSRLVAAVLLIKALGGGWDSAQLDNKPQP